MGKSSVNSVKLQKRLTVIATRASEKGAIAYRDKVRAEILASGRVDTGEMYRNIDIVPTFPKTGKASWKVIFRSNHFRFQDEGTRGSVAAKGSVLRFKPKGSNSFVFAKHTRGVTAGHFLIKARARMRSKDFT